MTQVPFGPLTCTKAATWRDTLALQRLSQADPVSIFYAITSRTLAVSLASL